MTGKYAVFENKKQVSNWVSSLVADNLKRKLQIIHPARTYSIKKAEGKKG